MNGYWSPPTISLVALAVVALSSCGGGADPIVGSWEGTDGPVTVSLDVAEDLSATWTTTVAGLLDDEEPSEETCDVEIRALEDSQYELDVDCPVLPLSVDADLDGDVMDLTATMAVEDGADETATLEETITLTRVEGR